MWNLIVSLVIVAAGIFGMWDSKQTNGTAIFLTIAGGIFLVLSLKALQSRK